MRVLVGQVAGFFGTTLLGLSVDLLLYAGLTALGVVPWAANLASSAVAVVVVYLAASRLTFRAAPTIGGFMLFAAWYAVSIPVFSLLIQWGVDTLGLHPFLSKLASLPFSFAANFVFSRSLFTGRIGGALAGRFRTTGGGS
jgi:putative flippase GtrA